MQANVVLSNFYSKKFPVANSVKQGCVFNEPFHYRSMLCLKLCLKQWKGSLQLANTEWQSFSSLSVHKKQNQGADEKDVACRWQCSVFSLSWEQATDHKIICRSGIKIPQMVNIKKTRCFYQTIKTLSSTTRF